MSFQLPASTAPTQVSCKPLRPAWHGAPTALLGPQPRLSIADHSADHPRSHLPTQGPCGLQPPHSIRNALVFTLTLFKTSSFTYLSLWTHANIY